jgi:uncharacterized membrane protein
VPRAGETRAVVSLAVVSAVVAAVPGIPGAARIPAAVLLLLILPGFALASAAFAHRRLDPVERVLLTVALSLAAAVLVALCLDVTPWGLDRSSWAVALAGVTVASALVAAVRASERAVLAVRRRSVRPNRAQTAALACGAVLLAGAFWLATKPLPVPGATGYTALWLVPAAGSTDVVRVGVRSGELEPSTYRLSLRVGARVVRGWKLRLAPSGAWEARVALPTGAGRVVAILHRGSSDAVYRQVDWLRGGPS